MDIKQLINTEIVKSLVRSSDKYVTAKQAISEIEHFRNYSMETISRATIYRIFDNLIEMGECRKVSGGYVSARHNLKKYVSLNPEQKNSVLKNYTANMKNIINNESNNMVLRCFYAVINVMLETDKALTVREISKRISTEYTIPNDIRRVRNIIDEITLLFVIAENDDLTLILDKDNYIANTYFSDDEINSKDCF